MYSNIKFLYIIRVFFCVALLLSVPFLSACSSAFAVSPLTTVAGIELPDAGASLPGFFRPADSSPADGTTTSPGETTSPYETTSPVTTDTSSEADTTTVPSTENKRSSVLICIDAGHGGSDSGTHGEIGGKIILEKDVNLTVALLVRDKLLEMGYSVMMTREGDTFPSLAERRTMPYNAGASMFISIHCNSYGGSGRAWGTEVYYNADVNYNAKALAGVMCNAIAPVAKSYAEQRDDVRAKHDYDYLGYHLAVLKNTTIPSLLIELGYMSDSSDLALLTNSTWLDEMAFAIARGVELSYLAGSIS